MNFYSVRDLRTDSTRMWQDLSGGGEAVLTSGGKPSALLVGIPDGGYEELVQAVRQAKAMIALNSVRARAERTGFLSDAEIADAIAEAKDGENRGVPSGAI